MGQHREQVSVAMARSIYLSFVLLSDAANLASFLPFREIIKVPEETWMDDKSFTRIAFA